MQNTVLQGWHARYIEHSQLMLNPVYVINNLRETELEWNTMFPFAPNLVEGYAQKGKQALNTLFLESKTEERVN